MAMADEPTQRTFACCIREQKIDYPGTIELTEETIRLKFAAISAIDQRLSLAALQAHRRHPKQPMIQIRFKVDSDLVTYTFVFKEEKTSSEKSTLDDFVETLLDYRQKYNAQLISPASPSSRAEEGPPGPRKLPTSDDASTKMGDRPTVIKADVTRTSEFMTTELQEARKVFLAENQDAADAYRRVVEGKLITEEQFWKDRAIEFAASCSQPTVEADSFLAAPAQLVRSSDKDEGSQIIVTEAQVQQAFAENPLILECYKELVPMKMQHKEFLTRFFRTNYYMKMIGDPCTSNIDPLFAKLELAEDPQPLNAENLLSLVPSHVNLTALEAFQKPGFGTISTEGSARGAENTSKGSSKQALMNRFNRFGIKYVKSLASGPSKANELGPAHATYENLQLEDLRERPADSTGFSKGINAQFDMASAKLPRGHGSSSPKSLQSTGELIRRLETYHWEAHTTTLPKADTRFFFLNNTSLIQQHLQHKNIKNFEEIVTQPDLYKMLQTIAGLQTQCRELLRLFWTVGKTDTNSKRIVQELKTNYANIKHYIDNTYIMSHVNVFNPRASCNPLLEAIKFALEHYERTTASQQKLQDLDSISSKTHGQG